MKNVSTNLKTHLAGEVTTLCACWLVTRLDGVVLGFTDHDVDIVFNGVTYSAESGFLRTAISNTATAAPGELEVQGFLDSVTLTEHDLRAGLYNYATVELFMLNWSSLADGPLNLRYGNFGEVTITSTGSFKIELRGLMQRLEQQFLETYGPICRADLGDARCKIQLAAPLRQSLAPYAVGARVTVPSGPIENIAIPNGDFSLTFTTTIPGWTLVNMSDTVGDVKTTAWLASITQSVLLSSVFGITDTDNAAVTFQVHNEDLFAPSGNQQYRLAITYLDGGGGVLGTDATPYAPLVGYGFGFFSMTGTVRPGTATVVFALQTNELGGPATFTSADALQFSDAEAYITPIGAPQAAVLTNPNFQLGSGVLVMDWLPLNRPANGNNLRSVNNYYGLTSPVTGGFFATQTTFGISPGLTTYIGEKVGIINGDVTNAEIDTGAYQLVMDWKGACTTPTDAVGVGVIFYDGSGNVISAPALELVATPILQWHEQVTTLIIPAGTRQIAAVIGFGTTAAASAFAISYGAIADILVSVQSQGSLTAFNPGTFTGVEYVASVAGISGAATPSGWSVTPGDTIVDGTVTWTVTQAKYLFIGTIVTVVSRGKLGLTLIGGVLPDQWLQWGVLIVLSGASQGFTRDIINHQSMVVTLAEPLFYTPAIGDRIFVQTGCDKFITTCHVKFNNEINFRGFPFMPGTDQYFKVGIP